MPAWEEEIAAAEEEGVKITYLSAPREVLTQGGRVTGMRCNRMQLGEPDASGRRRPLPIPDSDYDIEIDQLILAIGQRPDLTSVQDASDLEFSRWDTVEVDPATFATNKEGVFAGGDVVSGAATVISAMGQGKTAALSIHRFLMNEDPPGYEPPEEDKKEEKKAG